MSSIDTRVVEMKFDNAQFGRGVDSTLKQLQALNKGLKLDGASKGLNDIASSAKRFSLGNISSAIESVKSKFSAMSVVAITALATIANKAVSAGAQFTKSFTFGPIIDGFKEYELKMGSIQTILANTSKHGTTLKQVTATLDELNHYADKTIYNFGDMTRNIGLFTNAGIGIKDATAMIKGFSNEAASSGVSAQGAAAAAYQLSQALSSGKITLMDWKSLTNVGMGSANMKDGIIQIATAMDTFKGKTTTAKSAAKDFNGSLKTGWLTADVMQNYLKIQAGELSDAQMKSLGLTGKQITAFKKQAKIAQDAATKVRTASQLVGTIREAVGSGWTETFELLVGDFNQATKLWTGVSDVLGKMINNSAKARNNLIKGWAKMGGRTAAIDAIKNTFDALIAAVKPIHDAFREIFPKTTSKELYDITTAIRDFTAKLKMGADTADKVKRTFAGVFAILGIGWEVIKQVAKTLAHLFGVATKGSGSFLDVTASVGDFLVKLHDAIKNGEGLSKFFSGLGAVLAVPIRLIQAIGGFIADMFTGFDSDKVTSGLDAVKDRLNPLKNLTKGLSDVWSHLGDVFGSIGDTLQPAADAIGKAIQGIVSAISDAFANADYSQAFDAINTGLLAGLVLILKKFFKNFGGINAPGSGMMDAIKGVFGGLTNSLKTMQTTLKAATLLAIAGALGILTASVVALSMIDSKALTKALGALTVMFTQLMGAMAVFNKIVKSGTLAKLAPAAAGMILMSVAILILTSAVKKLAQLDWTGLAKGLIGTTVLIGALVLASKGMGKNAGGMIRAGAGLILLAVAIKILVSAVQDLSGLNWSELAKGLTGIAGLLLALGLFTRFAKANKGGLLSGAGIVLLAVGIKLLASAVKDFAGFSWTELGKGLAGMAGGLVLVAGALKMIPPSSVISAAAVLLVASSLGMIADAIGQMGKNDMATIGKGLLGLGGALVVIAGALALLPPSTLLSAAAIFVVASSLGMIAKALGTMGDMTWGEIAKGLVALAGSLVIIAGAMALMTSALAGAAALLVVTAALKLLVPVLISLAAMTWGEIAKGLITLAAAFAVIGLAGLVLGPLVPVLLGLGVAIGLLGVALLAAGVGVLAFAMAFTLFAAAGAAGAAVLIAIVKSLLALIPYAVKQIGLGVIALAKAIIRAAPQVTKAIIVVLNSLLKAIATMTPKIANTLLKLVVKLLKIITRYVPKLAAAGVKLMVALLKAIEKHIPKIVNAAANLMVKFLNALAKALPRVIKAGVNIITSILRGISNNLGRIIRAGTNLIVKFINGISNAMGRIVKAGTNLIVKFINGVSNGLGRIVTAGTNMIVRFIRGISNSLGRIIRAGTDLIVKFMKGISNAVPRLVREGISAVTKTINGIARAIRNGSAGLRAAGRNLASAIISGMTGGLSDGAGRVIDKARSMASSAVSAVKSALSIFSPSRVFRRLGQYSSEGMALGIEDYTSHVEKSSTSVARSAVTAMSKTISEIPGLLKDNMDLQPTITPVLDLSNVKKAATEIGGIMVSEPLKVTGAYSQAKDVSARYTDNQTASAQAALASGNSDILSFTQNNYSPKALSNAEIYRQTKNQISTVKGALAKKP